MGEAACHDDSFTQSERVNREFLTWNHLDRSVDFLPILWALKLPVQDKVAVVGDHRTLRDGQMTISIPDTVEQCPSFSTGVGD